MCGICCFVRQSLWKRSRKDTDQPTCPESVPASSSVAPSGSHPVEAFSVFPCACTKEDLRATIPPECRRCYTPCENPTLFSRVVENLHRRGPEAFGSTKRAVGELCVASESGVVAVETELEGVAAVLGLRGQATVRQPYEMEVEADVEDERELAHPLNKSFFLWNGEIFNGPLCPPPWGSDTTVLASRLSQLEQECMTADSSSSLGDRQRQFLSRCVDAFEQEIQGPYGFLFYASQLQMLVFGRDPLGRHSLLVHLTVRPLSASAPRCLPPASPVRTHIHLLLRKWNCRGISFVLKSCGTHDVIALVLFCSLRFSCVERVSITPGAGGRTELDQRDLPPPTCQCRWHDHKHVFLFVHTRHS